MQYMEDVDVAQGQQSRGVVFHMFHVVKTDTGNVMGCCLG